MTKKLILSAFVISSIFACAKKAETPKEVLRPVKYTTIGTSEMADQKVFTGMSKPAISSRLSFRVSGTLLKLYVKIGQQVKRQQVIGILDNSDYQLQFEEADAGVKNADAREKSAKSHYERISLLYENQNISLAEYESARAAFESAKAQESALKKKRKLAKSQLSYARLLSPLDGVIADVLVEENENVSAGQPVVVVNSDKKMDIEVSVPDIYISQILEGAEVDIRFSAFQQKTFSGVISEVGFAADYQTTYPVIIQMTESDASIRPGMSAEVTIEFHADSAGDRIFVPVSSVLEDQEGRFVYVVTPEFEAQGLVSKRSVEIGSLKPEGIEINSGLAQGERVITAGLSKLKDGMKVRISE